MVRHLVTCTTNSGIDFDCIGQAVEKSRAEKCHVDTGVLPSMLEARTPERTFATKCGARIR